MGTCSSLTLQRVKEAADVLKGVVHMTPLDFSGTFSEFTGSRVYLKLENLQRTGSFKIRGAYYALAGMTEEEKKRGVITASAGNHAQGVAYAASRLGTEATVVMPERAPLSKVAATKAYGARVILAGENYDEAYEHALSRQHSTGAVYIHAYDDVRIMAGQGTVALEILQQLPAVEVVVVPVGGGGLAAGTAYVLKKLRPEVTVLGVQAQAAFAPDEGTPGDRGNETAAIPSIADGIAVGKPGRVALEIASRFVDDMVRVDDEEVSRAMLLLLERSKLVVEGAGAAGLAALLQGKKAFPGKNVVVLLTGGNVDMNMISVIIERGLVREGRRVKISSFLPDVPGSLSRLLAGVQRCNANIVSINHDRVSPDVPLGTARVEMILETAGREHIASTINFLVQKGYHIREIKA